jgi:hypothetical protein
MVLRTCLLNEIHAKKTTLHVIFFGMFAKDRHFLESREDKPGRASRRKK